LFTFEDQWTPWIIKNSSNLLSVAKTLNSWIHASTVTLKFLWCVYTLYIISMGWNPRPSNPQPDAVTTRPIMLYDLTWWLLKVIITFISVTGDYFYLDWRCLVNFFCNPEGLINFWHGKGNEPATILVPSQVPAVATLIGNSYFVY